MSRLVQKLGRFCQNKSMAVSTFQEIEITDQGFVIWLRSIPEDILSKGLLWDPRLPYVCAFNATLLAYKSSQLCMRLCETEGDLAQSLATTDQRKTPKSIGLKAIEGKSA